MRAGASLSGRQRTGLRRDYCAAAGQRPSALAGACLSLAIPCLCCLHAGTVHISAPFWRLFARNGVGKRTSITRLTARAPGTWKDPGALFLSRGMRTGRGETRCRYVVVALPAARCPYSTYSLPAYYKTTSAFHAVSCRRGGRVRWLAPCCVFSLACCLWCVLMPGLALPANAIHFSIRPSYYLPQRWSQLRAV